jgi:hypothetical protein
MIDSLLTIPQPITDYQLYLPIGNEYVSLPTVRPDGGIESVNVLSMQARGLLEFAGDPLIAPRIGVEGRPLDTTTPRLPWGGILVTPVSGERDGVRGHVLVLAPPGYRGFVILLEATNGASEPREVTLEVGLHWAEFSHAILSRRETGGHRHFAWDAWTRSLVMEVTTPVGGAAMAVATTETLDEQTISANANRARLGKVYRLLPGEAQSLVFYFAVAPERDGARTTTMDLRRHGWECLWEEANRWVSAHRPAWLPGDDLGEVAVRNLMFNQFFAAGRTIDTDELALVTSRSPLYYVSAAFWARDALLWSFPGLLLTDPVLAREALVTAFARHFKRNAGVHAHYINGVVLYPGFELDQLAAFLVALENYVRTTKDWAVLREPEVERGLRTFPSHLAPHKHPRIELYSTFLLSTDDPAPLPYVTYHNVLLWKALSFLGELETEQGHEADGAVYVLCAGNVREAIMEHCVVDGPRGKQFAGAVDLEGRHVLFDEPPGSLALLAHYGFCPADHPIYRNTLDWIDSVGNPQLGPAGRFQTAACVHAPYSWTLSLANMLLSAPDARGERAAKTLRAAPLDGGLACESFDADTGAPVTGRHFATCAGFLGYALYSWLRNLL